MNVGACFYKQGKYKEAENAMRQSLRMSPNAPPVLMQMARISYAQGKLLETRGWYQSYFQSAADNAEILYIDYQTEKALDDQTEAASYALKLRTKYQASSQAKKLKN